MSNRESEERARRYGVALNGVSYMGMLLDHGDHIGPEFFPGDSCGERWISATDHAAALEQARREGVMAMRDAVMRYLKAQGYILLDNYMVPIADRLLSEPPKEVL